MAETRYSTTTSVPIGEVWEFVREMDHWAPFVTGYQSHEKLSDSESLWTLKGDIGVLARTVQFQVHITNWAGSEHVTFTLRGVNEALEGEGAFTLVPYEDESAAAHADEPAPSLVARLFRWLFRLFRGRTERGARANAGPGAGMARLTFRLRVDPGGPQAPMINAMLKPAMVAAAEDLANRILGHLEKGRPETSTARGSQE